MIIKKEYLKKNAGHIFLFFCNLDKETLYLGSEILQETEWEHDSFIGPSHNQ